MCALLFLLRAAVWRPGDGATCK